VGVSAQNQLEPWSPNEPYLKEIMKYRHPSEPTESFKRKIQKELDDDLNRQRNEDFLMEDVDNNTAIETEYEVDSIYEESERTAITPFVDMDERISEQYLPPWDQPISEPWQPSGVNHGHQFNDQSQFHDNGSLPYPAEQPHFRNLEHRAEFFTTDTYQRQMELLPLSQSRYSQATSTADHGGGYQPPVRNSGESMVDEPGFGGLRLPHPPQYPTPRLQQYGDVPVRPACSFKADSSYSHPANLKICTIV
jgi:hypothetical protein